LVLASKTPLGHSKRKKKGWGGGGERIIGKPPRGPRRFRLNANGTLIRKKGRGGSRGALKPRGGKENRRRKQQLEGDMDIELYPKGGTKSI